VGQCTRLNNAAPSLQPHYRTFLTTTGCSVPAIRFGTVALAVGAACGFSLGIEEQVLTFRTNAWLCFAPPTCRMPLGQYHAIPRADPGGRVNPRFWHRLNRFRHFFDGWTERLRRRARSLLGSQGSILLECRARSPGFNLEWRSEMTPLRKRMIEMLWGRGGEGVAPSARYDQPMEFDPCVSQTT